MMKITACILQIMLQIGTCAMVKHTNTTSGKVLICQSIKCRGDLEFCTANYTSDVCNPCPYGTFMLDTIDSTAYEDDRSIFRCVRDLHWSCPPEAEMVYGKVTDSLQPPCECDRSRGYYGPNPNNCEILDEPCEEGLELSIRGNCVPCPSGTFKPSKTFSLCKRKTNCTEFNRFTIRHGSTTSDAICGPLMPTSSDKGQIPYLTVHKPTTVDIQSSFQQSDADNNFSDIFSKRNIFLIIILLPAAILIIIIPIAIGLCIKYRYSVHFKCCMAINRRSERTDVKQYRIPLKMDDKGPDHVNKGHADDTQETEPMQSGSQIGNRSKNNDYGVTKITVHVQNTGDVHVKNEELENFSAIENDLC